MDDKQIADAFFLPQGFQQLNNLRLTDTPRA
jgi:hypothetical protein